MYVFLPKLAVGIRKHLLYMQSSIKWIRGFFCLVSLVLTTLLSSAWLQPGYSRGLCLSEYHWSDSIIPWVLENTVPIVENQDYLADSLEKHLGMN